MRSGRTPSSILGSSDKYRVLNLAETQYNNKIIGKDYYVRRRGRRDTTEVAHHPEKDKGPESDRQHFSRLMKSTSAFRRSRSSRLFARYKCKCCVVDGNGLGIGLVDFLVTDQIDPETDEVLANFGVYNDEEGFYKKLQNEKYHPQRYVHYEGKPNLKLMYSYQSDVQGRLLPH